MRTKAELLELNAASTNVRTVLYRALEVLIDIRDVLDKPNQVNPDTVEGLELIRQSEAECEELLTKTTAARVAAEAVVHDDSHHSWPGESQE